MLIELDKIKTEIGRRIQYSKKLADCAAEKNLHNSFEANELLICQYKSLLSFIESLEQEPSPKIKGWVARDNSYLGEELVLITQSPYCDNTPRRVITDEKENSGYWDGRGYERDIPNLFPDLNWESDPIDVELTIKKV